MPQFSKGDTFADGQQLTAARLNQLVDSATLLVGAITDQPSITANTLQSTDTTIVNDGGVLKEATIGDFLNSNIPITTSSITGGAGVDIAVTPAAGQKFDVGGAFEANSINSVGNSTIGGNETISGNLAVTGTTTLTGNATANGSFTSNGTANFTGVLQVNGSTAYVLYEVYEENLSTWIATVGGIFSAVVSTSAFTKPSDEIWVFQVDGVWTLVEGYAGGYAIRYSTETYRTGNYLKQDFKYSSGQSWIYTYSIDHSWTVPAGTALSSRSIVFDTHVGNGSQLALFRTTGVNGDIITTGTFPASKFRIYKYKTA